jgi:multidrug resistance efflux pump
MPPPNGGPVTEVTPMNMKSRVNRVTWMFGVALLVGSIAAAGWVMQYPRPVEAGPNDDLAKGKNNLGTGVVCLGLVDVESGLIPLGPLQAGSVTEVICYEGQKVRKGDPLLKIEDEPYVATVAAAETGVKIAQTKVDQARLLIDKYNQGVKQQEQAVEAAKRDKEKAELALKEARRLKNLNFHQPTDAEIQGYEIQVEKAKAGVTAEEVKLAAIRNAKPDAVIQEAEHNVELQKDHLRQAQEALNRCTLRAPQDGTILRVLATVGTQYNQTSTQPAINFAPAGGLIVRAEVEQEFHNRVTMGAIATINDETIPGQIWHGKVLRISEAFLPPRNNFAGPDFLSAGNNTRVREVIVTIEPSDNMPKLGQKMRVNIGGISGR